MNHKLLIVDDEPRLRESLKFIFENKGFSAQTASNGLEAINTFKTSPFKVIIADIQMPEMNGFEFFEFIKKIDPFVQVIFLTGYANDDYIKNAFKNNAFEFFKKPVSDNNILIKAFEKAITQYDKLKKNQEIKQKKEKTHETLKRLDSLESLSGGIAHQFNNALSIITGHLNLIEMDYQNEKRLNLYVKKMAESAKRMTGLTSSLLAYARGGKYQAQIFPVSEYISNIIEKFRQDLPLMLTMIDEINVQDCYIKADKNQLEMLIFSVLKNALEATQEIGTIKVFCEKEKPDHTDILKVKINPEMDFFCLTIADDGSGMDEETKERVFEPFFTTKFKGRGLGMAAAYGIVKNHDGYLFINSSQGIGTIVKIYLPVIEKLDISLQTNEISYFKKDIIVLLVEDDEAVMNVTNMMLERKGYTVLQASSGKKAIEIARSHKGTIHIALLDFVLPDMNGDIVYPLIQKHKPEMKVIVLSGYAITGPVQKLMSSGARAFLQKPVPMKALTQKIEELLEN